MARKTRVTLIDDIDGGEAVGTVRFGIDGIAYEIDLSIAHQSELREGLMKFREHATRLGRFKISEARAPIRTTALRNHGNRERNDAIRTWAAARGESIASRGRIPQRIVEAYDQANQP